MKAAAILPALLLAQGALADAIATCRERHAAVPAAHVACLEEALRTAGGAQQVPDAASSTAVVAATAPAAASQPPPATLPGAAPATTPPTGLGAEQAQARVRQRLADEPREQATIRIVGVRYSTATGLAQFTMADGQVWRETVKTPERHHLDGSREYDGRIERSALGGYRLYVDGVRWMHKVERIR